MFLFSFSLLRSFYPFFLSFFFFFFFSSSFLFCSLFWGWVGGVTSLIPCGELRSLYLYTASATSKAALPIPTIVCSMLVCRNYRVGCQYWGFVACAQMLMHGNAHRGCRNAARESALKVGSGRKLHGHSRESNMHLCCIWLFSLIRYQLRCPAPCLIYDFCPVLFAE